MSQKTRSTADASESGPKGPAKGRARSGSGSECRDERLHELGHQVDGDRVHADDDQREGPAPEARDVDQAVGTRPASSSTSRCDSRTQEGVQIRLTIGQTSWSSTVPASQPTAPASSKIRSLCSRPSGRAEQLAGEHAEDHGRDRGDEVERRVAPLVEQERLAAGRGKRFRNQRSNAAATFGSCSSGRRSPGACGSSEPASHTGG